MAHVSHISTAEMDEGRDLLGLDNQWKFYRYY